MGRRRTETRQVTRRLALYSDFKDKILKKGLTMQVEETDKFYLLKAIDGRRLWVHQVWKSAYLSSRTVVGVDPAQEAIDQTDFEANHKTAAEDDAPTNEMTRDGKLYTQATSAPIGATTYFTSVGDNPANPSSVGGGQKTMIDHKLGDADNPVDVDFNMAANKTYLHSGYLTWASAVQDTVSLHVVASGSTTAALAGTSYTTFSFPGHPWDGKLIIPAAPGAGDIDVTTPVLIGFYQSETKADNSVPRYWNATWNPVTQVYDSLSPALLGDGEFNMFTTEMPLFCFARELILEGTNYSPWAFKSSNSQRLGDGMFIRITPKTVGADHAWRCMSTLVLHREKTL